MTKPVSVTVIAAVVVVLLVAALRVVFDESSPAGVPLADRFDAASWKAAVDVRGRMVDDLTTRYLRKGMTLAEVRELLGTPDLELAAVEVHRPRPRSSKVIYFKLPTSEVDFDSTEFVIWLDAQDLVLDWNVFGN